MRSLGVRGCTVFEQRTENGVGQAGSHRHCGSHSSVALSPISVRAYFEHRPFVAYGDDMNS